MIEIGYSLSSEEHPPLDLIRQAERAEQTGFRFALISDHFHPWIDEQGQSPFVWSVIGGIAMSTKHLRLGTGVTCPLLRVHPAIVAQAAATAACMMPGRFFLGLGSGENLNEHIVGRKWPSAAVRRQMLEEAAGVIRLLWKGGLQSHRGRYFTLENARIYTLPEKLPEIFVAAGGKASAQAAARSGDGLIGVGADKETAEEFSRAAGEGKPRYAQISVCWAKSEKQGREQAHKIWPNSAFPWPLSSELPLPSHFEQAAELITEDAVADSIVCGPDPKRHIEKIEKCIEAGYDHVYVHQVGHDQEGFFRFYEREVLPHFEHGPKKRKIA
jgi:coenzyme F420-dependent glucose-6-phosphate dehydrogenase